MYVQAHCPNCDVQNKHLIAVYREHDRKQIHCRLNYLLETLNQQQRACVSTF